MFHRERIFIRRINNKTNLILFNHFLLVSTHIMSSPGEKRGTCGHVMAFFYGHLCREKGWEMTLV